MHEYQKRKKKLSDRNMQAKAIRYLRKFMDLWAL